MFKIKIILCSFIILLFFGAVTVPGEIRYFGKDGKEISKEEHAKEIKMSEQKYLEAQQKWKQAKSKRSLVKDTGDTARGKAAKKILKFADKLQACEVYKTTFIHPLTREKLTREILGIRDDRCLYIEGMPNGGKMECRYSKDSLPSMAQFYKDILSPRKSPKSTYKINGKIVKNPLQECLDNGDCVISEMASKSDSIPERTTGKAKKGRLYSAIANRIESNPVVLDSMALRSVFTPAFYAVEVKIHTTDQAYQTMQMLMAETKDGFVFLEKPSTNQKLPNFKKMIKSGFTLKTKKDAAVLMEAIDALFPENANFGEEKIRQIRQKDNRWELLMGEFFQNYSGYLIVTDVSGAITDIEYSLRIPRS